MVPRGHAGQAKPETAACTRPRGGIITERAAFIGGGATGIGYAMAAPDAIAAAVAFLASADAGYIDGTVLTVDGGRTETL